MNKEKKSRSETSNKADEKELECLEGSAKTWRQLILLIGTLFQPATKAGFHQAVHSWDCEFQGRILI
jgi:hypothetical protein